MKQLLFIIGFFCLSLSSYAQEDNPYIQVLGVAQDGGYPHAGCTRRCCNMAWEQDSMKKYVVSLALVNPATKQWWLFEATPDIKEQLHYFRVLTNGAYNYLPDGIFVTHAHIGHYTGLMQLGREVMNTKDVAVYTLPKMKTYIETNGPWSQLVKLNNIILHQLDTNQFVALTDKISIETVTVPHRDEYSETAGFRIKTGIKKYLFIPDINKWNQWSKNIIDEVKAVDIALVDATFYDDTEPPTRSKGVVYHPFVTETISLFDGTDNKTKAKVYFIHLNHTNPLLWDTAKQTEIKKAGYHIAAQGEKL
jgi:pyrroloquinoline quinone biosynthesis protein B